MWSFNGVGGVFKMVDGVCFGSKLYFNDVICLKYFGYLMLYRVSGVWIFYFFIDNFNYFL